MKKSDVQHWWLGSKLPLHGIAILGKNIFYRYMSVKEWQDLGLN